MKFSPPAINKWVKGQEGNQVFYFDRNTKSAFVSPNYISKAVFDERGVLSLQLINDANAPLNIERSQKKIGKALKEVFKTKEYICVIDNLTARDNNGKYKVEFYAKLSELPSEDTMMEVYDAVAQNEEGVIILALDPATKEVDEVLTYPELLEKYPRYSVYTIMRICNGTEILGFNQNGKPKFICGHLWKFAK